MSNVTWNCPLCKRTEKTSPAVLELCHTHNKNKIALLPFKKERKPVGQVTGKSLKDDAWDIFSVYIRRRDADENGYVACCTCGKVDHWKNQQAGHYISRRHGSVLFDERNCHSQCINCNIFLHGCEEKHAEYIKNRYGERVLLELQWLKNQRYSFNNVKLQVLIKLYTKKVGELDGKI